jgi:hypothetical protein
MAIECDCRQLVRFEEGDGEGLATLDCTNDVESRQTIQVVGTAHWRHMNTGNALTQYSDIDSDSDSIRISCRRSRIVDTGRSCHQTSATQPRIAWYWLGSCLWPPAATSSRADGHHPSQVPLDRNGVGLGANPSQARMYF